MGCVDKQITGRQGKMRPIWKATPAKGTIGWSSDCSEKLARGGQVIAFFSSTLRCLRAEEVDDLVRQIDLALKALLLRKRRKRVDQSSVEKLRQELRGGRGIELGKLSSVDSQRRQPLLEFPREGLLIQARKQL
jgi:hypothetical protein